MKKEIRLFILISSFLLLACIPASAHAAFTKDLRPGMVDPDVQALQHFLNSTGFSVAASGPGSLGSETLMYGRATRAAVAKFQEAHRDAILIPQQRTAANGIFGPSTRAFVNKLLALATPPPSAPSSPTTSSGSTVPAPVQFARHATPSYPLTYTAGTGGTITGNATQRVLRNTDGAAVTAQADDHYHFTRWSDGSTDNPRTDLQVQNAVTVTASFDPDTYTLTYTADIGGSLTGTATQTVTYGQDGTEVTAIPDDGFTFIGWTDGSLDNPRIDLNVQQDITAEALFSSGGGGGR